MQKAKSTNDRQNIIKLMVLENPNGNTSFGINCTLSGFQSKSKKRNDFLKK
jgi:hypothetical protein